MNPGSGGHLSYSSFLKRTPLLALLTLLVGAGLLACEQQPVQPSLETMEPRPSHGVTGVATAKATLHPMNGSRVKGRLNITDDGSELTVTGSARGLDSATAGSDIYISLFYGIGSVPGGPTSCQPAPAPFTLSGAQMSTDFWDVDAAGMGSLGPVSKTEVGYVSVEEIGTVSIRDTRIGDGVPQESVVACGKISVHPAGR